jgi:sterol desaturase/sphingolipid hydroxylase (fatty acid hydroxylase superfamily)
LQDDKAIDKNYAVHFAFIDHLFGTAVQSDRKRSERYGVQGDHMPNGFWSQLKFPFTWKG